MLQDISEQKETVNQKPLRVCELVLSLKNELETKHRDVRVIGEVSSFKQWRSGHCYFDIKDEKSVLPAVMFKPHFARVPFEVKDGMEVLFIGRISVYAPQAKMQMLVSAMKPMGQGALFLLFEQLKEKLSKEGLFDKAYKKGINKLNPTIGLVTSSHGAALRDMVRIIKSRSNANIILLSARMQGKGAGEEISHAISMLDELGICDVIIVGRGGGSLEDLWAFNEEIVARAIYKAKTPIISAVGHETDFTIADFVADMRAATPTHAAQIAAIDLKEAFKFLSENEGKLDRIMRAILSNARLVLGTRQKRLSDPRLLLYSHFQKLDESSKKMNQLVNCVFKEKSQQLKTLKEKLEPFSPRLRLKKNRELLYKGKEKLVSLSPKEVINKNLSLIKNKKLSLDAIIRAISSKKRNKLENNAARLDSLSPLKVLKRGFSLIEDEAGHLIHSVNSLSISDEIRVRLKDGHIFANITKKEKIK